MNTISIIVNFIRHSSLIFTNNVIKARIEIKFSLITPVLLLIKPGVLRTLLLSAWGEYSICIFRKETVTNSKNLYPRSKE